MRFLLGLKEYDLTKSYMDNFVNKIINYNNEPIKILNAKTNELLYEYFYNINKKSLYVKTYNNNKLFSEEYYFQNNSYDYHHREDGPAIIIHQDTKKINKFYLNSNEYSFEEWAKELNLDDDTKKEILMKFND